MESLYIFPSIFSFVNVCFSVFSLFLSVFILPYSRLYALFRHSGTFLHTPETGNAIVVNKANSACDVSIRLC